MWAKPFFSEFLYLFEGAFSPPTFLTWNWKKLKNFIQTRDIDESKKKTRHKNVRVLHNLFYSLPVTLFLCLLGYSYLRVVYDETNNTYQQPAML